MNLPGKISLGSPARELGKRWTHSRVELTRTIDHVLILDIRDAYRGFSLCRIALTEEDIETIVRFEEETRSQVVNVPKGGAR